MIGWWDWYSSQNPWPPWFKDKNGDPNLREGYFLCNGLLCTEARSYGCMIHVQYTFFYICGIYTFTSLHLKYLHTPMCCSRPQPVPPKKTYQRWMKLTWATNLCVGVELCHRIPLQLQQLQLCSRPRPTRFRTWGGFLSRNNPTKTSQKFVRFVFGFLFGVLNVWEGIWIDSSSVGAVGAGCCFSSCDFSSCNC